MSLAHGMSLPGLLLGLSLLLSACSDAPPPPLKVQVGQPFPDLVVKTLDGETVTTQMLRGRGLVFNVWATWCAPCRKELPSLQRLQARLADRRVVVVGMAVDDDEHRVREYLIDRKVRFTSYIDPQRLMANEVLGVRVYPATFVVDADGMLRWIVEGEREWDSAETLEKLQSIFEKPPEP